jgi:hypothetical protein
MEFEPESHAIDYEILDLNLGRPFYFGVEILA